MKKRIISLLLVFCMMLSLFPVTALAGLAEEEASSQPVNPFADVQETDWFYEAVQYANTNGFFKGTGAGSFAPNDTMTRSMFVTVLGRMAGIDPADYAGETPFNDVAADAYYAPYVVWAAQYDITTGTGDGAFLPDAVIDRAQMAVFFVRYFETFEVNYDTGENITTEPSDLEKVPDYAKDAVCKLWQKGLLNGNGEAFEPDANASRAQVAALSMRTDKSVETWYKAPGVPSERVRIDPNAPQQPENPEEPQETQKPQKKPSSSGGSSGGSSTRYYEVSFALGEGQTVVTLPTAQTVAQGTSIETLPTPFAEGVIFLGWFYDAALTEGVAEGDTVQQNLTLYAMTAESEQVQSMETPNYITKTEVDASTAYTFGVTGTENKADIQFINVTGGNIDVDFTLTNGTVTAALEAGQTYQVELLADSVTFTGEDESVRYLNLLTKKAETTNASLNQGVKQIPLSAVQGLDEAVFNGLYTVDETQTTTENTTTGTFTYTTGGISVGDTVAVTDGAVDLKDVTSTTGDVAYLKIISVNGNTYTYEMADVDDVLFVPDVLPIASGWDTDGDITNHRITITPANLATAMSYVEATTLDVGDYLGFLPSGVAYAEDATVASYGEITSCYLSGDDYIIEYKDVSETDIESALDVYYEQDRDIDLTEEEQEEIIANLLEDVADSGYTEQAAAYIAAAILEGDGLDTIPEAEAILMCMDEIDAAALARGSTVVARGSKVSMKPGTPKVTLKTNQKLSHLSGKGFYVTITIPFTVKVGDVNISVSATFEEEILLKQKISTKRHKIGFLKYDYSLNASFDVGSYTGVHFNTTVTSGVDKNKLNKILDEMTQYSQSRKSGTTETMNQLSAVYTSLMKSESEYFDIIERKIFETNGSAFLHIFCWQVKGSFVVSANLTVALGMSFDYTMQKQYNFSVRVKAKTSTNETVDIISPRYNFDFYVVGMVGVRAGIRLEMYVGLISLKLDKIGITAEVGAYAELYGYFIYHLDWVSGKGKTTQSAGAMLIEIGIYLEIKFVAQVASKWTYSPTLYSNQWKLWSTGERYNIYAFQDGGTKTYTMKTTKTLALPSNTYSMKSMDLKTGKTSTVSKDDNKESQFNISFSNKAFSYNPANNTVTVNPKNGSLSETTDMTITWKKASLAFTSTPIRKTVRIQWSDPNGMRYLSFDSNGGSAVNQISAGSGAAITWPANPTKEGYTFAGWYTDSVCNNRYSGSTTTMPTFSGSNKGMTLYAKWTPATVNYTVERYLQALNGAYALDATETKTGTTATRTAVTAAALTGFTAKNVEQQTIAADGSTVVKVYYDRNSYSVTFVKNDGSGDKVTQTYKYGAELSAPSFSREGYLFQSWDTTLPNLVTGNATYTAQWVGKDNTILFDTKGGSTVSSATVKTGQTVAEPTAPTKAGFDFKGWFTDSLCTKQWSFASTVTAPMTLYAKWEGAKYTVTFDVNGGAALSSNTMSVTYGTAYGSLPTPERTGYTFQGWFTAKDGGERIETKTQVEITADQTLYAQWTAGEVEYTVKHYQQNLLDNEYTEVTADAQTLTGLADGQTTAEAKTYEGFTAQDFQQTTINADGSTVIEIYYDRNTFTVTWKNHDGTTLKTDEKVKFGATPSFDGTEPTKTLTGHTCTFSGWSPDVTAVAGDVTYTAQFTETADTYTITYVDDLQQGNGNPEQYTYGVGLTLSNMETEGYTFDGWYTEAVYTNRVTEISKTQTGNITLYAKWTAKTYNITYELNGGTNDSGNPATYTYGVGVTLKAPERSEYSFLGWYLTADLTGACVTSISTTQTDDMTLYAKWATSNQSYDIWVGGIQVTDANSSNVLGGSSIDDDGNGTGIVSFDASTQTLTLSHVKNIPALSAVDAENDAYAALFIKTPITIRLVGENTIDLTDTTVDGAEDGSTIVSTDDDGSSVTPSAHSDLCNIYSMANITIQGAKSSSGGWNGSLTLTAGPATQTTSGLVLDGESRTCTLDECGVVINNDQDAAANYGIRADGTVTLTNAAELSIYCQFNTDTFSGTGTYIGCEGTSTLTMGAGSMVEIIGATQAANGLTLQPQAQATLTTSDDLTYDAPKEETLNQGATHTLSTDVKRMMLTVSDGSATTYSHIQIAGAAIQVDDATGAVQGYEGVSYDSSTHTLTLKDATIEYAGEEVIYMTSETENGVTSYPVLQVLGENTVRNTKTDTAAGETTCGIKMVTDSDAPSFTGDGTLTVEVADNTEGTVIALYVGMNGSPTMMDGPTLIARAGTATTSYGIQSFMIETAGYAIQINSGSLTAQGNTCAVLAYALQDADSQTLTVTASTSYDPSTADSAPETIQATKDNLQNQGYKYITTIVQSTGAMDDGIITE